MSEKRVNIHMDLSSHLAEAKVLWDYHCRIDPLKATTNSLILGLGSYDVRVATYCADLYLRGYSQKILFTGKWGNWTQHTFQQEEAEVFSKEAIRLGVPPEDIILEKEATNIGENIIYARNLVKMKGLKTRQIILVTKPNTTRRAYATFAIAWPEMINGLIISAPKIEFNVLAQGQTIEALINELVGDLERIIIYPSKGFQIKQIIPDTVISAYEKLRSAGYLKHCTLSESL